VLADPVRKAVSTVSVGRTLMAAGRAADGFATLTTAAQTFRDLGETEWTEIVEELIEEFRDEG
jgi:hypothetical protein